MWPNPQFPADLVTFTEKILNGKLHFLCSEKWTPGISVIAQLVSSSADVLPRTSDLLET